MVELENHIQMVMVGDEEYIIKNCSATQQYEIIELFFQYGLDDALYRIAMGERELVAAALLGNFSKHATTEEKRKVTAMLLNGCTKVGAEKPISIDDFHNNMLLYMLLQVEALKVNFSDFMQFLQSPEEEAPQETAQDKMSPV